MRKADLKGGFEFGRGEGGHQHRQRHIVRRRVVAAAEIHEEMQRVPARLREHEALEWAARLQPRRFEN